MNKDVIYIDVEDDITAIIGKVKDASQKVVALVPPKRIGVLQSTVNLRLLARAATQSNKRLVIISNNPALVALAASAQLPVAKNLQSKPELAQIAALDVDDGEDVIDGAQLPVGELARTADTAPLGALAINNPGDSAVEGAINENAAEARSPRAQPPVAGKPAAKPRVRNGAKVPNFSRFRKKFLLIIAAVILLVGFLVWAIFFASRATVVITARTTDSSVNNKVTLANDIETDVSANTLQSTAQQTKKQASVEFEATGTKDVGKKATGTMQLTRTNPSLLPLTVPAGTEFTAANRTFISTESATLTTRLTDNGVDPGSATVDVQAAEKGGEYNLSARSYQSSMNGIRAEGNEMSGGTHREIKVVSADDIEKATDQLKQQDTDAIKKQLAKQLGDDVVVIEQTFNTELGSPSASPAVDQEVGKGDKPKLTSEITYSLSGVTKDQIDTYLDAHFAKQLQDLDDQRTYNNGSKEVSFTSIAPADAGFTANIVATAKIGPKIEDDVIKSTAKGKRYGEIQSSLEAIQGIDTVDVKFWPFWVKTAPNNVDKIMVEFTLNESK